MIDKPHVRHRYLLLSAMMLVCLFLYGCERSAPDLRAGAETAAAESSVPADTSSPASGSSDGLTVRFLDVGQADASLISCGGYHILIDGGNKDDSDYLYSLLKTLGIPKLDLIIATHPDEDHIGGIPGALMAAEGETILCSTADYDSDTFSDFRTYAEQKGSGISVPETGDMYTFGDLTLEILAVNCGTDTNDSSIVTKAAYGDISFLFTGDAELMTESCLLAREDVLRSTVLKVSHHGSGSSSSAAFLDAADPDYAVISAGRDNPYGHPAAETLNRLRERDISVLRTDLHGDIVFFTDGISLSVSVGHSREETRLDDSEITYIFNIRSGKFHLPSCGSVADMSLHNQLSFAGSREEAMELGFCPCGGCKP